MSRRPTCFGSYQGENGELIRDPIGACRQCSIYRKCQLTTKDVFIQDFQARIREGEKPVCWAGYPASDWLCGLCPFNSVDQCPAAAKNQKVELADDEFRKRVLQKVHATWGSEDGC